MRSCIIVALALLTGIAGAQTTRPTTGPATRPTDPEAPGFDDAGSDRVAIVVADAVMKAMGGRHAWDRTRYLTWDFFGHRRHLWDKHAGRVRIEGRGPRTGTPYVMLIDLDTGEGRAWKDGVEVTGDELAPMLEAGVGAWINDSYWLVMPYKLKDAGVTLRNLGPSTTVDGVPAVILSLTFTGVGQTPQNKYHVWVAKHSGLIEQWAFFREAKDTEPAFTGPWAGWQRHGGIMLSGDRGVMGGEPRQLTGIAVLDTVPESAFTTPDPIDWDALVSTE